MIQPILVKIWEQEKIPLEWKEGLIVKIPKKEMLRIAIIGEALLY
jgi:hypothetical protein